MDVTVSPERSVRRPSVRPHNPPRRGAGILLSIRRGGGTFTGYVGPLPVATATVRECTRDRFRPAHEDVSIRKLRPPLLRHRPHSTAGRSYSIPDAESVVILVSRFFAVTVRPPGPEVSRSAFTTWWGDAFRT